MGRSIKIDSLRLKEEDDSDDLLHMDRGLFARICIEVDM